MTSIPAYLDRNLKNRKNEKWKDIPGLEAAFKVSSYGRIKRLKREVIRNGLKGGSYFLLEKIIAPRVMKTFNKLLNDFTFQLSAHLAMENKRYHLVIRRLVYYCFVETFPIDDNQVIIVSKKGNGLDINPDNLLMIKRDQATARIYKKERMISSFRGRPNTNGVNASLLVTRKQVSRYSLKGTLLETYPSIMDASRATGINHALISHTLTGRQNKTGNFYWSYGKKKRFDFERLLKQKRLAYKEKRGTRVAQYGLNGKYIRSYLSLSDAGLALNKSYTCISANIRGITKHAYGFVWRRE